MIDPINDFQNYDYTLQGPGFFVFFSNQIEHAAGYDFPDRPPSRREEKREVKVIVENIAKRTVSYPKKDQELALRLALQSRNIEYKRLYLQYLMSQIKKKKRRKLAITLLLS